MIAQTSYSYNSLDWLTGTSVQSTSGTSNTSYDYNAAGEQVGETRNVGTPQEATTRQLWDFQGHLRAQGQVDANGVFIGNKTAYAYDASGMPLSQATLNAAGALTDATSYLWDGDRVSEERDENGVLQASYEHGQELGPLRLLRKNGANVQSRYFIGDGQDSTRQLLDENGAVKDSYFYDAFGTGLSGGQGDTLNSFKYTGQQQDTNGLYYLRARYYNVGTGRFLSQDPEMGSASDPVSMHRYLYASDNPANFTDPTGRESLSEQMSWIAAAMPIAAQTATVGFKVAGAVTTAVSAYNIYSDHQAGADIDKWDVINVSLAAVPSLGRGLKFVFNSRWVNTVRESVEYMTTLENYFEFGHGANSLVSGRASATQLAEATAELAESGIKILYDLEQRSDTALGYFSEEAAIVALRSQPTFLTLFHEMTHVRDFVSDAVGYGEKLRLERELHVFEEIIRTRVENGFINDEIKMFYQVMMKYLNDESYINQYVERHGNAAFQEFRSAFQDKYRSIMSLAPSMPDPVTGVFGP